MTTPATGEAMDKYGLLPCPCCGNPYSDGGVYPANREETLWTVACGNVEGCGLRLDGPSHLHVKTAWNRRTPPAEGGATQTDAGARPTCATCGGGGKINEGDDSSPMLLDVPCPDCQPAERGK